MRHFMMELSTNSENYQRTTVSYRIWSCTTKQGFTPFVSPPFEYTRWTDLLSEFVYLKKSISRRFFMQLVLNPALYSSGLIFVYYEFFPCKILCSPGSCVISPPSGTLEISGLFWGPLTRKDSEKPRNLSPDSRSSVREWQTWNNWPVLRSFDQKGLRKTTKSQSA